MIPQGLFRVAATARFISENHPGVLNKVKTEAENPAKTPEEGHKLVSAPQDGTSPNFEEALVLKSPVPPEHFEIAPTQERIACNHPQQGPVHVPHGSNEVYPQIQQPDNFNSDRMDPIPKPSPTTHQNADQDGLTREALDNLSREKSGNESSQNSSLYPIFPVTDKIPHMVPELPNDSVDTITLGLQYSHLPCANGSGTILPNPQPQPCESTNTARNPFSSSALILPKLSVGISGTLNQGPPRFGTANILYPMNQPNTTFFPHHITEINPSSIPESPFNERDPASIQLMPILSNVTQILHRIPGLTTLWPEMGNIGVPAEQKSEGSNEMSNI